MNAQQKLRDLAVSDTGFLFDPFTGVTYTTNPAGLAILRGLQQGLTRDEIVAAIGETFALGERDDTRRDLDEFLHLLRQHGLLPWDYELS